MLTKKVNQLFSEYEIKKLLRKRFKIDEKSSQHVLCDGKKLINFSSNDYLQLYAHETVLKSFIKGAEEFGLGSGSSAMVSGFSKYHHLFEEKMAAFLQREKAVLFNSGYHANLGVITTLADRNTLVVSDKLCHASLTDAVLLARSKYLRYRHHDYVQAEKLLYQHKNDELLVISESVFSIQGSLSDIKRLSKITTELQKILIVDDAHGIGVLGKKGKGICELLQLSENDVPYLVTPLGKGMAGMGAIVSGKKEAIESLVQFARTYRYSTALPAAICAAMSTTIDVLEQELWRKTTLQTLINYLIKEAKKRRLTLLSEDQTPIKSILIGSNKKALMIQEKLMEDGFLVGCIRPPTVPIGSACIRISLNCFHIEKNIDALLDRISEYLELLNAKNE